MSPTVSVIIPAYNAAGFITKTLEAVAAQTYRDFELIVVDDGSKDDTHGLVERFIRDRGLSGRCIRQPNKKIAGARNTGVRAAQGELVSFLDHDDLWLPVKLEVVMAEFARHPDADLVCHNENILRDGEVIRTTVNGPLEADMYGRLLFKGNALSPSAVTVRRAKLLEVGGFREDEVFNTVEDYDLWMRLAQVCRFHFIPRVLGSYVLVDTAASARVVYHHTNTEHLLREHFARYPRNGLLVRLRMRRRLADVYRSAARALLGQGDVRGAGRYVVRMLGAWPLDPKNLAATLLWAAAGLRRAR